MRCRLRGSCGDAWATGILLLTLLSVAPPMAAPADLRKATDATEVRIGLRAHRGAERALRRWAPTARHLEQAIPGHRFVLMPFETNAELNEAVSRGEFDFVLTNPASFVEYQRRYGARALATLVNKRQGRGYTVFGSVIFTRADRDDINTLQDLKGKTFIGVSELGFGGWRVAWREMRSLSIDPYRDFAKLMFAGGIQPRVVDTVLAGEADAGAVRTDMLERLAAAGKIDMAQIKVLGRRDTRGFPFLHSTRLYPEWPFAQLPQADPRLTQRVSATLLAITADMPAAVAGNYVGWHPPLDYQSVDDLLRDLAVGPYLGSDRISLARLIREYGVWLATLLAVVLLFTFLLVRLKLVNNRLRDAQSELRSLALHDQLTGLPNRHQLEGFLQRAWGQAARRGRPVSVLMFDIDHFKDYNDQHGHLAGDECLRQVATAAAQLFRRAGDLVARYGGEEFLVVLMDTTAHEALAQAEQLRHQVEGLAVQIGEPPTITHVTISIGVASGVARRSNSPQALIAAADGALYRAKETGRNRVSMADDCAATPP